MEALIRGSYLVRLAGDGRDAASDLAADLAAVLDLRARAFRGGQAGDGDDHDARCRHVMVLPRAGGAPVAAFRVQDFAAGAALDLSYSARSYDLGPLRAIAGPKIEMGRFCLDPLCHDPEVVRLAWAAMTRLVDGGGHGLMFGCSSFRGADPARHGAALAALAAHVGPEALRPRPAASDWVPLPAEGAGPVTLPPLLRSYLGMGGWVSDHVVIDRDLDTCHVFTAVEVARIPPARVRALRALAAG